MEEKNAEEELYPLAMEHISPATRLLEKRRQVFEVQEALDAQKEEFTRREEAFRRREDSLRRKDLELQQSLIKFNKFLQENEQKKGRAEKRSQDEARQRKAKEQEIEKLEDELDRVRGEFERLEEIVARNYRYQRFLESVQEAVPDEYPEVFDIVNRFKTLKATNQDLCDRLNSFEAATEEKRGELIHYMKGQSNDILNFNNEIAGMQKSLENSERDAVRVQVEVDSKIRNVSDRTLELGQTLMAIQNLMQRCTSKSHGNVLEHQQNSDEREKDGTERLREKGSELERKGSLAMAHLEVIASFIRDLTSIAQNHTH